MENYIDIMLDDDGDLFDNKNPIGNCWAQNIEEVLKLEKGALNFAPTIGANLHKYLDSETDLSTLRKELKLEIEAANIAITNDELNVILSQLKRL